MNKILIFDFNEKSSVLLIFFFHAVIFSFLLLKQGIQENKKDSTWLAAFIGLGGLYICPFMLGYAGWYSVDRYREFMFFLPFQQLFLIGPVFFFYIKSLLNADFKLIQKDRLHFLLPTIYFLYSLIVFVSDKLILDEFYFYADQKDKDLDFWYQMAGLISMLYYLFHSLRYYINYRKLSLQEVSYADEIAFTWIKYFTIAFGIILVLRVLFFISNPEWGQFGSKYWYYLCFSILLQYISIRGYSHSLKTTLHVRKHVFGELESVGKDETEAPNHASEEAWAIHEWKDKINHLFETEFIHQKSDLTLTHLAQLLNTNRNIVSKAINQAFGMNFNDFVNEKRAEAVIEKLKKGEHRQNTLLGIALDCGFNSKTTFNRAFKKYTGTTPKQFIDKNQL